MRAYQIKVNGKPFSLPFTHHQDCIALLSKTKLEDVQAILIEAVEIGVGDSYRTGNVVYRKDEVFKGVVSGCYYSDHPEHV